MEKLGDRIEALEEEIVRNSNTRSLAKINQLKKEKNKLEADLSTAEIYSDKNKYAQTEAGYKKAAADLDKLNKEYELVFERIVHLEAQ